MGQGAGSRPWPRDRRGLEVLIDTDELRGQLAELLDGVGAHMPFEEAVADFPDDAINVRAPSVDYTPWHLVEHLRLTQADILDYVTNPEYAEPDWPADYWPDPDAIATRAEFDATIARFLADKAALRALIMDLGPRSLRGHPRDARSWPGCAPRRQGDEGAGGWKPASLAAPLTALPTPPRRAADG